MPTNSAPYSVKILTPSLTISPASGWTVDTGGDTQAFTVTALRADGTPNPGVTVTLASDQPGRASVPASVVTNGSGEATFNATGGASEGAVVITGTGGGSVATTTGAALAPFVPLAQVDEGASWAYRRNAGGTVPTQWWASIFDLERAALADAGVGGRMFRSYAMHNDDSRPVDNIISQWAAKAGASIAAAAAAGYRPVFKLSGDVIWVEEILYGASAGVGDALKPKLLNIVSLARASGAWRVVFETCAPYVNDPGQAWFADYMNAWLRGLTPGGANPDAIADLNADPILGALGGGIGDDGVRPYTTVSNPGANPNTYTFHGLEYYPFPPGALPTASHAKNWRARQEATIRGGVLETAAVAGRTLFARAVSHNAAPAVIYPADGVIVRGQMAELEDRIYDGAGGTGTRLNPVDANGDLTAGALVSSLNARYRDFPFGADVFARHVAISDTWDSPQAEHPVLNDNNTLPHQPHRLLVAMVGHPVTLYRNTFGLAGDAVVVTPPGGAGTAYNYWDGQKAMYRAAKAKPGTANAAIPLMIDPNFGHTLTGGRVTTATDSARGGSHLALAVSGTQGPLDGVETIPDLTGGAIGDVPGVHSWHFDAAGSQLAMAAPSALLAFTSRVQWDFGILTTAANPGTDQVLARVEWNAGAEYLELWAKANGNWGYKWSLGGTTSAVVDTGRVRVPAATNKMQALSLTVRDAGGGFVQVFLVVHGVGQYGGAFDPIAGPIVGGAGRVVLGGGSCAWKMYYSGYCTFENNPPVALTQFFGRLRPTPYY